jgi:hypothetical protein
MRMPEYITTAVAAGILNLSRTHVANLARKGLLVRIPGYGPQSDLWDRQTVIDLAKKRAEPKERLNWKNDLWAWGNRAKRPENLPWYDRLITTREAAEILRTSVQAVRWIVRYGYLPCYQKKPNCPGSRMWLRHLHVTNYAKRYTKQPTPEPKDELIAGGWEKHDIEPYDLYRPSRHMARDYHPYYSTRQAAMVLGIGAGCIRALRLRGRIKGYRARTKHQIRWKRWGVPDDAVGNRWWFFLKEDIHAFQADPQYARRRKIWEKIKRKPVAR